MDSIPVLQTVAVGDSTYLHGEIHVDAAAAAAQEPKYLVVIVDDNSGSMNSSSLTRRVNCIRKTQLVIDACFETSYHYSTFGSSIKHYENCASSRVPDILRCCEGTQLVLLAKGAMEAAERLIAKHISTNPSYPFRLVFILNTDGESDDGEQAGNVFQLGYQKWKRDYPQMVEARSFVLGIGDDHDQRVLSALAVGEGSYYNYPDANLSDTMCHDTEANIIPEVVKSKRSSHLLFNSGRSVDCTVNNGVIDLSEVRVLPGECSFTLSDSRMYTIDPSPRVLSNCDPLYFNILIRDLESDVLKLVKTINVEVNSSISTDKATVESYENERTALLCRRIALLQEVDNFYVRKSDSKTELEEPMDEVTLQSNVRAMLSGSSGGAAPGIGVGGRRKVHSMLLKLRNIAATANNSSTAEKFSKTPEKDRLDALEAVLDLCTGGLQILRVGGKLSREIERDYMEILGSGGFKHWTGKKKSRVVARALDQVNASAEAEADRIVARSMNDRSLQNQDLSLMKETFLSRVFNYLIWGSVHGASAATKNNSCWFTLLSDSQLTADGDVLCIGAYIPPGHRNLPLCSVSSALVLHKLIMRGDITICPKPMSFMALRGILQGGHHVARGPHGHPINSVLCLLPTPNSHLSNCITRAYQALAASQLLTTRWIYTAGTSEYRNGVLSAIMGIVAAAPGSSLTVSSSDKDTLLHGLLGFYGNYSGTPYLNSVLQRAADFDKGFSTSGEVSTFLVAIGDKMLQLMQKYECGSDATRENRSKFWRIVLLRILRDHFSDTFTAFVEAGDADGDRKRQEKSMEADTFIEIMVQGLNFPTGKDGFVDSEMVMSFIHELGYGIANTELLDLGGISLENIDEAGISCGGEEEDDQCEFDAFFDSYEMDADILGGAEAESVPMHERDSSRDTSRSHMWFSPSNAHLQLSRGISGSMTLRNVVKVALQWHGRLGSRSGDPRLSQTDAEILAVPSDLARIALINRVVDSIEREVEIIVRAELHMKNLEATLSEITGVVCHDSPALIADSVKNAFFDLAGVTSTSEEALRWILSQILFAVELRANGEYRRQQTGGTELTSNAPLQPNTNESTSSTIGPGVMLLDADALILRLNKRISRKQSAAWIASEIVRKNKLKAQLTRVFLQHPQHLSPLPLVIYSPTHRDAISNWTNVHMGYDIVSAVHPITEKPTGMASNTFLTRRSKYFMQKCNPYEAIAVTFGTGEDRSLTEFCDHFHTFAFDTYLNTWELGSKSFYEFKNALKNRYGEKVDQYSILVIWVDCVFQKSLSNTFAETEAILKECSSFGTTTEDQDIILQELINNVKWYNKPGEFLDEYFSSKECYPHCIISIEDFAAYCERMGIVPSDFELSSFEASGQFASPKFLSVDRNEIHELIREVYSELSSTSL